MLLLSTGCSSPANDSREESSLSSETDAQAESSHNSEDTRAENSLGSEGTSQAESDVSMNSSETVSEDGVISVYYVKDLGAIPVLLSAAEESLRDEMTLEIREFADYASMLQVIDTDGMPDLVLLDETYVDSSLRLDEWADDYKIADLSPFIAAEREDGSLRDEDYFAGTFYAGERKGGIYYLPLSLKTYFGVTSQSHFERSALGELDASYTLQELTDALLTEKTLHEEDYIITLPIWISSPSPDYLCAELLLETGAYATDPLSGEPVIDEAAVSAVQSYMELFAADMGIISSIPNTSAFDALQELHFMTASNLNLAHQFRYWQSAYSELLEETMKPIFFPCISDPGSYGAMANIIGAIGSRTVEKAGLAYRLMRAMMDLPASTWTNINIGDAPNFIGPVSKIVFEEELQQFTDNYGANYLLQFSRFKRLPLGEEERTVLMDWADKVQVRPLLDSTLLDFARELLP